MANHSTKRDANHGPVVAGLTGAGCLVFSLAMVGGGCPDLLVWSPYTRSLHLLEVKRPDWKPAGPKAKGSATERAQRAFALRWPVSLVQTEEQALKAVGAMR